MSIGSGLAVPDSWQPDYARDSVVSFASVQDQLSRLSQASTASRNSQLRQPRKSFWHSNFKDDDMVEALLCAPPPPAGSFQQHTQSVCRAAATVASEQRAQDMPANLPEEYSVTPSIAAAPAVEDQRCVQQAAAASEESAPTERCTDQRFAADMVGFMRDALAMLCVQLKEAEHHNALLEQQCAMYDSQIKLGPMAIQMVPNGAMRPASPLAGFTPAALPRGPGRLVDMPALIAKGQLLSTPRPTSKALPSSPVAATSSSTTTAPAHERSMSFNRPSLQTEQAGIPAGSSASDGSEEGSGYDMCEQVSEMYEPNEPLSPLVVAQLQKRIAHWQGDYSDSNESNAEDNGGASRTRLDSSRESGSDASPRFGDSQGPAMCSQVSITVVSPLHEKKKISFHFAEDVSEFHSDDDSNSSSTNSSSSELYEPRTDEEISADQREFQRIQRQMTRDNLESFRDSMRATFTVPDPRNSFIPPVPGPTAAREELTEATPDLAPDARVSLAAGRKSIFGRKSFLTDDFLNQCDINSALPLGSSDDASPSQIGHTPSFRPHSKSDFGLNTVQRRPGMSICLPKRSRGQSDVSFESRQSDADVDFFCDRRSAISINQSSGGRYSLAMRPKSPRSGQEHAGQNRLVVDLPVENRSSTASIGAASKLRFAPVPAKGEVPRRKMTLFQTKSRGSQSF